mmetsp:Transcript_67066/g.178911  ORF Transcript_67066/g.178911 Transcript_67066/m.178911 type:complete len:226 (-) Transcript_67066:453-1130(-)
MPVLQELCCRRNVRPPTTEGTQTPPTTDHSNSQCCTHSKLQVKTRVVSKPAPLRTLLLQARFRLLQVVCKRRDRLIALNQCNEQNIATIAEQIVIAQVCKRGIAAKSTSDETDTVARSVFAIITGHCCEAQGNSPERCSKHDGKKSNPDTGCQQQFFARHCAACHESKRTGQHHTHAKERTRRKWCCHTDSDPGPQGIGNRLRFVDLCRKTLNAIRVAVHLRDVF